MILSGWMAARRELSGTDAGGPAGRQRHDPPTSTWAAIRAGVVYCVIVFGIGFCLGALRVLALAPHLGERVAVMLEAPVMLAASWAVSLWYTGLFQVPAALAPRLLMGSVAFILLMVLEAGLAVVVFGRPVADFFAQYRSLPGSIGLAAQFAFGLVPIIQGWQRSE